jgi:bla regulator protein blaR1
MTLPYFSPLANHLWQSTLFALAAGLLTLALRKNHARTRHGIWLAASLKFLVPFALLVSAGKAIHWKAASAQAELAAVMEQFQEPFAEPAPMANAASAAPGNEVWFPVVAAIWVCGAAGVVLYWFRRWRQVRRAAQSAAPLDLQAPIPVLSSTGVGEPGVFGVLRPVLLLPTGIAERLEPAQMRAILAHELCHVRRRDNLTGMLHMLVEAVFWFHPLVWWLGARLIEERERACDEEVLGQGSQPEVYAEGILNVCKFYVESPVACVSGVTGANLKKRIEGIMANRTTHNMNLSKKALLVIAACAAFAAPLFLGLLNAQDGIDPAAARKAKQVKLPPVAPEDVGKEFEVATIKPNKANSGQGQFKGGPGRLALMEFSPYMVIKMAFGNLADNRISGAPKWIQEERFDIAGQFAEGKRAAPPDMYQPALRKLLADRFGFKFHWEPRQMDVYELVVAKNGSKLRPSSSEGVGPGGTSLPGKFQGSRLTMAVFANRFPNTVGRIVVDKTGLSGEYDIELTWTPDPPGAAPGEPGGALAPIGPSIFAALEEQLGLKLQPGKAPLDVLVIDAIERPTEN